MSKVPLYVEAVLIGIRISLLLAFTPWANLRKVRTRSVCTYTFFQRVGRSGAENIQICELHW